MAPANPLSRRQFFKQTGGLLIGFSLADLSVLPRLLDAASTEAVSTPSPGKLDSWLRIEKDGIVRVFTGKVDIGMGVETALGQIVAEELDVPVSRVEFVMGDTALTPDQGGVGGSTSIMMGAQPLRNAAATARFLLLQLASRRLGAPPGQLRVNSGIVGVSTDPSRNVSYGELAGGNDLNDTLEVTGSGFSLDVEGLGKPKDPKNYTIVGQPIPRVDLPPKILGQFRYVTDVRVPGMLHGRVVRPAGIGATVAGVDEESVKGIPGYLKTVVEGNFVGVVAESEWAAIRAAEALKVRWNKPAAAFPSQADLYRHMRAVSPKASKVLLERGDAAGAMAGASRKVEASFEWPFQAHATMGPGCALADVRTEGVTTIWCGAQKPHELRKGIADLLRVPADQVQVIWAEDAGSYGRPGYADAAADAAVLSRAVGKPVRVQWMRADMTGWGPKAPAVICDFIAGLDARGEVVALESAARVFSGAEINPLPNSAGNFLAGQLLGLANTTNRDEFAGYGAQSVSYNFPNVRSVSHVLPALFPASSPLRTTHLRDPEGPAVTFAAESFVDEIAAAAGMDPIEFRLKYLTDPRAKAVLSAAAERAGWDRRPSPKNLPASGDLAAGRGVALCTRGRTYVATVAEVEIHRPSGAIRVKRLACAHDCGLIVNPDGLRGVIAANLVQSLSRTLKEEVTFNANNVTSVDWAGYPVAMLRDVPAQVDIVLLNHPEIAPSGAGEPATRPTAAAIANAIFDATGARLRRAPLTPARILAALARPRPV